MPAHQNSLENARDLRRAVNAAERQLKEMYPGFPKGLRRLILDCAEQVILNSPDDIYEFLADYIDGLVAARDGNTNPSSSSAKSRPNNKEEHVNKYNNEAFTNSGGIPIPCRSKRPRTRKLLDSHSVNKMKGKLPHDQKLDENPSVDKIKGKLPHDQKLDSNPKLLDSRSAIKMKRKLSHDQKLDSNPKQLDSDSANKMKRKLSHDQKIDSKPKQLDSDSANKMKRKLSHDQKLDSNPNSSVKKSGNSDNQVSSSGGGQANQIQNTTEVGAPDVDQAKGGIGEEDRGPEQIRGDGSPDQTPGSNSSPAGTQENSNIPMNQPGSETSNGTTGLDATDIGQAKGGIGEEDQGPEQIRGSPDQTLGSKLSSAGSQDNSNIPVSQPGSDTSNGINNTTGLGVGATDISPAKGGIGGEDRGPGQIHGERSPDQTLGSKPSFAGSQDNSTISKSQPGSDTSNGINNATGLGATDIGQAKGGIGEEDQSPEQIRGERSPDQTLGSKPSSAGSQDNSNIPMSQPGSDTSNGINNTTGLAPDISQAKGGIGREDLGPEEIVGEGSSDHTLGSKSSGPVGSQGKSSTSKSQPGSDTSNGINNTTGLGTPDIGQTKGEIGGEEQGPEQIRGEGSPDQTLGSKPSSAGSQDNSNINMSQPGSDTSNGINNTTGLGATDVSQAKGGIGGEHRGPEKIGGEGSSDQTFGSNSNPAEGQANSNISMGQLGSDTSNGINNATGLGASDIDQAKGGIGGEDRSPEQILGEGSPYQTLGSNSSAANGQTNSNIPMSQPGSDTSNGIDNATGLGANDIDQAQEGIVVADRGPEQTLGEDLGVPDQTLGSNSSPANSNISTRQTGSELPCGIYNTTGLGSPRSGREGRGPEQIRGEGFPDQTMDSNSSPTGGQANLNISTRQVGSESELLCGIYNTTGLGSPGIGREGRGPEQIRGEGFPDQTMDSSSTPAGGQATSNISTSQTGSELPCGIYNTTGLGSPGIGREGRSPEQIRGEGFPDQTMDSNSIPAEGQANSNISLGQPGSDTLNGIYNTTGLDAPEICQGGIGREGRGPEQIRGEGFADQTLCSNTSPAGTQANSNISMSQPGTDTSNSIYNTTGLDASGIDQAKIGIGREGQGPEQISGEGSPDQTLGFNSSDAGTIDNSNIPVGQSGSDTLNGIYNTTGLDAAEIGQAEGEIGLEDRGAGGGIPNEEIHYNAKAMAANAITEAESSYQKDQTVADQIGEAIPNKTFDSNAKSSGGQDSSGNQAASFVGENSEEIHSLAGTRLIGANQSSTDPIEQQLASDNAEFVGALRGFVLNRVESMRQVFSGEVEPREHILTLAVSCFLGLVLGYALVRTFGIIGDDTNNGRQSGTFITDSSLVVQRIEFVDALASSGIHDLRQCPLRR